MTLGEKQQLRRLIQKLPAGNLDRVVEIVCRNRPVEEQSFDKIFVDLEKEVILELVIFYLNLISIYLIVEFDNPSVPYFI